jgi:hypothetical protein
VSIKGSPYANFSRALETLKLSIVLMAAAELKQIQLDDALEIRDPHGPREGPPVRPGRRSLGRQAAC